MKHVLLIILIFLNGYTFASELRCGWLQNPGPANLWLTDSEGRWDISLQGGYSALGIERIKDFTDDQYVKTNGNYGYGCACIKVNVNFEERKITQIYSFKMLPLERCQSDKKLPLP